jgi:hypothetical protein
MNNMADNENTSTATVVKKEPLKLVMGDTIGKLPGYLEGYSLYPDNYKIKLPKDDIHKLRPDKDNGEVNNNE